MAVKRVGVHLQALRPGEIGGLEDYVRHLLAAMAELEGELTFVLFGADYNAATLPSGPGWELVVLTPADFASLDASRLAGFDLDVWFCPLLVLEPASPGLPAVATLPDLQHEVFPELFSRKILEWRREHYLRTVRCAERVLTFSRYSKDQIVERLGADPHRVVITHLDGSPGLDSAAWPPSAALAAVRERYALPADFFYYPGASWPHKNHRMLFEALAQLRDRHGQRPSLVLTGAAVEDAVDLDALCRELGLEGQVKRLGYIPRDDVSALFALSRATVFPSLFEGFGIPVVEAMRAGSPVLCSTAASLPEVAGDAAVYFDPERPDELCRHLLAFCSPSENGPDLLELAHAGRRQAARFSWRRTAEITLETFQDAVREWRAARSRFTVPSASVSGDELPLISVVTPSFNQGDFIERTIQSVIERGYPRVEHLVIDGGSTDSTVEVLRRYLKDYPEQLDFVSEPDRGQAHAVNKGFDRARGEIIGWLNSDDTYEPEALAAVAEAFQRHPDCDVIYGRAHYVDQNDELLGAYPTRTEFHWQTLAHQCFICQPSVFLRRRVLDRGWRLDESLQMCMDYDFWIRLGRDHQVCFLDRVLAASRMYEDNKTVSQRTAVYREVFHTVKKHYGRLPFSWALGRAHHVWDRGDPFFNVRRLTWMTYVMAGGILLRHNWRRPASWPSLCREVWAPLNAQLRKRFRALYARGSTT